MDHLTGRPWWDKESTTYASFLNDLESRWQTIRDEGVALLTLDPPHGFSDESENLRDTGKWQQFELFSRGRKNVNNCNKVLLFLLRGSRGFFSFKIFLVVLISISIIILSGLLKLV